MPPDRALGHLLAALVGRADRRGRLLFLPLALGLLAAPPAAAAQPPAKVPRIGWLATGSLAHPAARRNLEAFRQGLRDLGYVEGQNIALDYRWAEGKQERLHDLAAELVRGKVDVMVTAAGTATLAAQQATRMIPVVMVAVGDPVASGLVVSLARPGGNITGLSLLYTELGGKRVQLLTEVVPGVSRVGVLWNPANPSHGAALQEVEEAARALAVQVLPLEFRRPTDFDSAFHTATRGRAGALIALDDPLTLRERGRIVGLAAETRLPAMYGFRESAEAGGLMAYGASIPDMFRRAATYVDKILKGAKPADLPVEQPTRFELVINMRTAKALGLTIPRSVLSLADHVIQ